MVVVEGDSGLQAVTFWQTVKSQTRQHAVPIHEKRAHVTVQLECHNVTDTPCFVLPTHFRRRRDLRSILRLSCHCGCGCGCGSSGYGGGGRVCVGGWGFGKRIVEQVSFSIFEIDGEAPVVLTGVRIDHAFVFGETDKYTHGGRLVDANGPSMNTRIEAVDRVQCTPFC